MRAPEIIHGDCVEEMQKMDENSIDAVICDPPYGLEFMGKKWDRLGGDSGQSKAESDRSVGRQMQDWHERWAVEALRVLKPGGYLLAFGGTRVYHRLACAVEDAGFEIRDRILVLSGEGGDAVWKSHPVELSWIYGSGFP